MKDSGLKLSIIREGRKNRMVTNAPLKTHSSPFAACSGDESNRIKTYLQRHKDNVTGTTPLPFLLFTFRARSSRVNGTSGRRGKGKCLQNKQNSDGDLIMKKFLKFLFKVFIATRKL